MAKLDQVLHQNDLGPAPALIALIQGGAMAQIACAAAELRIADLLVDGPKHVSELAQATESHAPSLHRLLRALASLELCNEHKDGSFALSAMGSLLRTDAPDSLRSWLLWFGRYHWPVWAPAQREDRR
jgi:orsellinic acid C2-O-methyltransferase